MFKCFDLSSFGNKLRKIRHSKGFTQKEVEKISGVTADALRRIETGKVVPRYDTLIYLSHAYKADLLSILKKYSNANALFEYYYQLEEIIIKYDFKALKKLKQNFSKYINSNLDKTTLVNASVAKQFKTIVGGIEKFYSPNRKSSFDDFYNAMKITHPTFEPEIFEQFGYLGFEFRVLFLVATSLLHNIRLGNSIFAFCLENTDSSLRATTHEKLIRVKIFFNMAYNFHRLDEHQKALTLAEEGIHHCNKNHISYGLGALLYRKGIAEFYLEKPNFLHTLQQSIMVLEIQDNHKAVEDYKIITKKTYGIEL